MKTKRYLTFLRKGFNWECLCSSPTNKKYHNLQYLPIEGLAAFNKVTAELLFGADNAVIQQQRVSQVFYGGSMVNLGM